MTSIATARFGLVAAALTACVVAWMSRSSPLSALTASGAGATAVLVATAVRAPAVAPLDVVMASTSVSEALVRTAGDARRPHDDPLDGDLPDRGGPSDPVRIELTVGFDAAGQPVRARADGGISVVGVGALARSVYGALVVELASEALAGDELRVTGWAPSSVTALRRREPVVAPIDDDVAVAALVDVTGGVRGAVTLTGYLDAPTRTTATLEIGRTRCCLSGSPAGRRPIDPVLPVVSSVS